MEQTKTRLHLLDTLRGITIISMVIYHSLWNLAYLQGVSLPWFSGQPRRIWQQSICITFIFLSGFCRALGSKHLKRGLMVFGGGALVTLTTLVVLPDFPIIFGVLTFLGTAMLAVIPFENLFKKIPHEIGVIISLLLFLLFKNCNLGFLGFGTLNLIKLPEFLYANYLTAFFGFPNYTFYSTDYFSFFPWFFLFLCGYFFCLLLKRQNLLKHLSTKPVFFLNLIGRHSLIIYLAHQPILYLIFSIIF